MININNDTFAEVRLLHPELTDDDIITKISQYYLSDNKKASEATALDDMFDYIFYHEAPRPKPHLFIQENFKFQERFQQVSK